MQTSCDIRMEGGAGVRLRDLRAENLSWLVIYGS